MWRLDGRVLDADRALTQVASNVAQLGYRLNRLEGMLDEQLGSLEARLARIETLLAHSPTTDSQDRTQD